MNFWPSCTLPVSQWKFVVFVEFFKKLGEGNIFTSRKTTSCVRHRSTFVSQQLQKWLLRGTWVNLLNFFPGLLTYLGQCWGIFWRSLIWKIFLNDKWLFLKTAIEVSVLFERFFTTPEAFPFFYFFFSFTTLKLLSSLPSKKKSEVKR